MKTGQADKSKLYNHFKKHKISKVEKHCKDLEQGVYPCEEIQIKGGVFRFDLIVNIICEDHHPETHDQPEEYNLTRDIDVWGCLISWDDDTEEQIDDFNIKI